MLLAPVLRRALALWQDWYFIQGDYALGKGTPTRNCSDALRRAGA